MFTLFVAGLASIVVFALLRFKSLYFINFFAIGLVCILIIINRQNNDFDSYEEIFQSPFIYADVGYAFLVELLKVFGANGHTSVLLFFSLLVGIVGFKITSYSRYSFLWFYLYLIFILPLDITQIRFGIASFGIIYSVLLFHQDRKFISYCLLLLASSVHYFAIIPASLFFMSNNNFVRKNLLLTVLLIFIVSFLLFLSIGFLSAIFPVRTLLEYQSFNLKYHSLFFWVLPLLVLLGVLKYFSAKCDMYSDRNYDLYKFLFNMSFLSVGFFSGLLILFEFNRLYRFSYLLTFLAGILLLPNLQPKKRILLSSILVAYAFLYGIYYSSELDYDWIFWG